MKTIFLALSLVLPARALDIPRMEPNNEASPPELKAALEAHMDGDDAKARRHLAACVKKAAPYSPDLSGCRIYREWWAEGAKQIDAPSKPEARRLYSIGVFAYKKGDLKTADAAWHDCLGESEVATAVRNDCMAMIDLIPKPEPPLAEKKIRAIYMEGFAAYGKGNFEKARAKWTACLKAAPADSPTLPDCRAGLDKIAADKAAP